MMDIFSGIGAEIGVGADGRMHICLLLESSE
jgi:hypothetical protein